MVQSYHTHSGGARHRLNQEPVTVVFRDEDKLIKSKVDTSKPVKKPWEW